MDTKINFFKIGLFVIALLLSLLAFVFWLGKFGFEKKKFDEYQIYFKESVSGLNIGLGIGATKYSQNYQDSNPTLVSYNATDFVSRLDASYAFKLDQNWLLGIGATYDLTNLATLKGWPMNIVIVAIIMQQILISINTL